MNIDRYFQDLRTNYDRVMDFYQQNTASATPDLDSVPESLEELGVTLEELSVAQEELLRQNRELQIARDSVERESQRYHELFDLAPDGYLVTDEVGAIREANLAAARLLQVDPAFLSGKSLVNFIPLADRPAFRTRLNRLREAGRIDNWEMALSPRGGEPIEVSLNARVQRWAGEEKPSLLWSIRDIGDRLRAEAAARRALVAETTNAVLEREIERRRRLEAALRESEARYRYIFETVGVAIWECDFSEVNREIDRLKASGVSDWENYFAGCPEFVGEAIERVKICKVNETARQLCEAGEVADLFGSPRPLFTSETLADFTRLLSNLARGETLTSGETVLQTLAGNRVEVLFTSRLSPGDDPAGRVLLTAIDIGDRVRAQQKLQQQAAELDRLNTSLVQTAGLLAKSNQDLSGFVYSVSHDLKAPLRGIANLTIWIEEDLEGRIEEDTRYNLNLLKQRVERMAGMIDGLLLYSRVGREAEQPEEIDVNELVQKTIEAPGPIERFRIDIVSPLPSALVAKRSLLSLVFSQLIDNAIRHHDRDSGRVEIFCRDGGDYYEFAVRDDGPGIAPEHHERIFGIFQSIPRAKPGDNIGIGLALVKKIIEVEGGNLRVESNLGEGATFYFTRPK